MTIRDNRGRYNEETKIYPRLAKSYTAAATTAEQKGTAF